MGIKKWFKKTIKEFKENGQKAREASLSEKKAIQEERIKQADTFARNYVQEENKARLKKFKNELKEKLKPKKQQEGNIFGLETKGKETKWSPFYSR